jgi:hypothetical protein
MEKKVKTIPLVVANEAGTAQTDMEISISVL